MHMYKQAVKGELLIILDHKVYHRRPELRLEVRTYKLKSSRDIMLQAIWNKHEFPSRSLTTESHLKHRNVELLTMGYVRCHLAGTKTSHGGISERDIGPIIMEYIGILLSISFEIKRDESTPWNFKSHKDTLILIKNIPFMFRNINKNYNYTCNNFNTFNCTTLLPNISIKRSQLVCSKYKNYNHVSFGIIMIPKCNISKSDSFERVFQFFNFKHDQSFRLSDTVTISHLPIPGIRSVYLTFDHDETSCTYTLYQRHYVRDGVNNIKGIKSIKKESNVLKINDTIELEIRKLDKNKDNDNRDNGKDNKDNNNKQDKYYLTFLKNDQQIIEMDENVKKQCVIDLEQCHCYYAIQSPTCNCYHSKSQSRTCHFQVI